MYRPCEPIVHYIKMCVRGSALHGYVSMMTSRQELPSSRKFNTIVYINT